MATNDLDVVRATSEGPSEQTGRNLVAALARQVSWTEAVGFPCAGTCIATERIVADL
jgi:hypothetical protein